MKKRVLSLALLMSVGISSAFSQDGTTVIKGTILDDKGAPAAGAEIVSQDGSQTTWTNDDGTFEIEVPANAANEISVSFGDYVTKNVSVTADGTVSYTLVDKAVSSNLTEVVVTGYRNYAPEKYVGAADMISAKQIEKMPVADITKAIEGAAPGIQVTSGSGQPGSGASVQIRGNGSLSGSSAPLYVVDGAVFSGDITSINPLDVENITILKDATATSLYGSRGANGVIVITTKRGKSINGQAQVTVDVKTGIVQRGLQNYDVMKSESNYYETIWRAYVNNMTMKLGYTAIDAMETASGMYGDGIIEKLGGYNSYNVDDDKVVGVDGKINPNATLKYHDDWDKEISRVGYRNEANLNISGNADKTDYYFSMGYLKEEGFVKYSDYERFSGRMNINSQVKNYLKVGLNLSGTFGQGNNFTSTGSSSANPMFISKDFAPILPVYYYDAAGNKEIDPITGDFKYDWGGLSGSSVNGAASSIGDRPGVQNSNVLGALSLNKSYYNNLSLKAVPYAQITFNDKFNFLTMVNYSYYNETGIDVNNTWYGQFAANGGLNQRTGYTINDYTLRQQLNYNDSKGDHTWGAFLVHENQSINTNSLSASVTGVALPGNQNLTGATNIGSANSADNKFRLESYLIGANYDFDNTYFLEGSLRWDGVSRFAPEARWNDVPFWSIGGGWDMKKADFLKDVSVLNRARLKTSYGSQGNENIGNWYIWQSLYNTSFPNGASQGALIDGVGNADLTWEFQKQFNLGVEFGLWGNRLFGEVNFFNKTKSNLLYQVPTAPSMGIQTKPMNVADMYNRGVEVTLGARIVDNEDFKWTMTVQATHYKNKITKMPEGLDSTYNGSFQLKEGYSMYDFNIVESAGVDPNSGAELYWNNLADGTREKDSIYANVSLSGRTYLGSAIPDLFGSIQNEFTYKGFDLSFLLTYGIGGKYYDGVYQSLMGPGQWGGNWHNDILNSWTPENPSTTLPRLELGSINIGNQSSRFLVDASYLNIRNISLGYSFSSKITEKMKIGGLRLYGLVDNAYIFSQRQGMNPQSSFTGTSDWSYTPARTIMFGARITL